MQGKKVFFFFFWELSQRKQKEFRNNGNRNNDHNIWEDVQTYTTKQIYPGDIEDKENDDDRSMKKNGHEKVNFLYYGCAFFCCLIGLITNGWLGAVWSVVLILGVYQMLPT